MAAQPPPLQALFVSQLGPDVVNSFQDQNDAIQHSLYWSSRWFQVRFRWMLEHLREGYNRTDDTWAHNEQQLSIARDANGVVHTPHILDDIWFARLPGCNGIPAEL